MKNDINTAVSLLRKGEAPGNADIIRRITTGLDDLANFIDQKYFAEYIACGGGKIKFVTGKEGSGKTHFLQLISDLAKKQGFITVNFSAKNIWLHDFKEIYAEIFRQAKMEECLYRCAGKIVGELGYDYADIPEGMTFADYLSSIGEFDVLIKKEIRNQLREMFLKNPLVDNNFAIACSLLTGGILGHPVLGQSNKELLYGWLVGSKEIKLTALRSLGMSPIKITKFNARHMLRSLVEVQRTAALQGIIILIDDIDILINATSLDTIRYTKLKREDAYESIRELIDEIDTLGGVMFFFAFDRLLIDNELSGMKSYQALWLRVQNEIISGKFNKFTDIIDLDRYMSECFSIKTVLRMSERIADAVNEINTDKITRIAETTAIKILKEAQFMKTSLPRQIVTATVLGLNNMEEM